MNDENAQLKQRIAALEREMAILKQRGYGYRGIRKRSATMLWGLPLYDIAMGPDPEKGELRGHARGIIAVGDFATGVLAIGGMASPMSAGIRRTIYRMIYGTVCSAMFFSFWGTVLGGLWADDSWGRFWGWDPKENGALIIVIWNALILHARWDGMVKERGFALLAVAGNIVTAWSWFGVNELGVGLHSYGFTDGVLFRLGMFALSQLAVIMIGVLIPRRLWWSYSRDNHSVEAAG